VLDDRPHAGDTGAAGSGIVDVPAGVQALEDAGRGIGCGGASANSP